ncbi:hypothetical protein FACS1894113_4200 [Alphaproteobacteria bacterium]|nr:hypothetical protein FACS1894113_4200 [Alphaproteobacteria bacterium]
MLKKIDYNEITRKARTFIVKDIIKCIELNGVVGKQHLYVTFSLEHKGVEVSEYIREDFDTEMTIILQHEFWALKSDAYGFSVSLSFEHGDEKIYIPFSAISNINDPSEDFYLDLEPDFSNVSTAAKGVQSSSDNIVSLDLFRK